MLHTQLLITIKPLTHLKQLFGLFAGSFCEFELEKNTKISLLLSTYLLVIILMIIYQNYLLYHEFRNSKNISLIKVTDIAYMYSYIILMLSNFIINYIQKSKFTTFIHKLGVVSSQFEALKIQVNYNRIKRTFNYNINLILCLWIIYFFHYNFILCQENHSFKTCFLNWIIYYVPQKITLVQILEISTYIQIFKEHFKAINSFLKDCIVLEVYKPANYQHIKQLEILHSKLCQLSETLNSIYSFQILLSIINQFIVIFSGVYLIIFGYYFDNDIIIPRNILQLSLPLCVIATPIASLWLLLFNCQKTYDESRRTGALVHKLELLSKDIYVQNELYHFSLKLIHENFEMNACGCFPINKALLHKIACAMTIYLVILSPAYN